ncbi:hypothetical protein ACFOEZ_18110 [Tianweitania populi]|uniref:hypothetical protein n=1 Tax=Tianweitania populi TaxID=1607949 RepID=UPI0016798509|nr:hypothetical protein [Tianweitania populi]
MSAEADHPQNLVLKWRQDEQNDAFLASNQMRCSASYMQTLQQGIARTCIIYIPKGGVPNRPDLNACFAAKAVLHRIENDLCDGKRVMLHLANMMPLPFPTPRELAGVLLEFGEAYGRRDYSREQ